jgi:hypothetical protein
MWREHGDPTLNKRGVEDLGLHVRTPQTGGLLTFTESYDQLCVEACCVLKIAGT